MGNYILVDTRYRGDNVEQGAIEEIQGKDARVVTGEELSIIIIIIFMMEHQLRSLFVQLII